MIINDVRKVFDEKIIDDKTNVCGEEFLFFCPDDFCRRIFSNILIFECDSDDGFFFT